MTKEDKNPKNSWWQPALAMFVRMSGWIIGPVLAGIAMGKWLDKKYNTDPWLFLLSVGIAFVVSMIGIVKDAVREIRRIEEGNKSKKSKG